MKEKRHNFGAVVFHDKIYAAGGYNGDYRLSSAEKYDVRTNQWLYIEKMNQIRYGCRLGVFRNTVFAVGGYNKNGILNTTEWYNNETNTYGDFRGRPAVPNAKLASNSNFTCLSFVTKFK